MPAVFIDLKCYQWHTLSSQTSRYRKWTYGDVGNAGHATLRVIRVFAMFRTAVLLCAVMLTQAIAAPTLLEHSVCQSACPDDASDEGSSLTCDEVLAARRVVIAQPASPRGRWHGPEPSSVPSPAPDEILHVPKLLLA
jgi:hypothetical protein